MEVAQPQTAADIPAWEGRLAEAAAAHKTKAEDWNVTGQGLPPDLGEVRLVRLTLELLKAGVSVVHHEGNLVLNDVVVLSADGLRWRRRGLKNWKRCETLADPLDAARTGKPSDVLHLVSSPREIISRYNGLMLRMDGKVLPFAIPPDPIEAFEAVQALADKFVSAIATGTIGPTPRQLKYATDIARLLEMELPDVENASAIKDFITTYKPIFDERREERRAERAREADGAGERTGKKAKPKTKGKAKATAATPAPQVRDGYVAPPPSPPASPPDYSRQKPVEVPGATLAKLGVTSVMDLVRRVNDLRVAARRPYVARSQFPTTMQAFDLLAREINAAGAAASLPKAPAGAEAPNTGKPAPAKPQATPTVTAPAATAPAQDEVSPEPEMLTLPDLFQAGEEEIHDQAPPPRASSPRAAAAIEAAAVVEPEPVPEIPYDPETPLIDFVADNLALLPERQSLALDRRFYISGSWKGYDALARELGSTPEEAAEALDEAWSAFGRKTGCWTAIRRAVLESGLPVPVMVGDLQDYDWDSGLPQDVVLLILERAAGLRHVAVEGHGDFLMSLGDGDAQRLHRALKHHLPRITNPVFGALTLTRLQQSFDGRIDEPLRRIVESVANDVQALAEIARAQPSQRNVSQGGKSLH